MPIETEIIYHGLTKRPELEELIREKVAHLQRLNGRLSGCRVALDRPHRHKRHGNGFRVQVSLLLPPRQELVASEECEVDELVPLVHRAFEKAERRLQRAGEKLRGEVKHHAEAEAEPEEVEEAVERF